MYRSFVFSTLVLLFASVNTFAQTTKSRTVVNNKQRSATTVTVQKNSKTLAAAKRRGGSARLQTAGTQRKVVTTNSRYNQTPNVVADAPAKKNCGTIIPVSAGANTGYEVGRPANYNGGESHGQVAATPAAVTSPAKARAGAARIATPASAARRTGVITSSAKQTTPVSAKQRAGAVAVDARARQ